MSESRPPPTLSFRPVLSVVFLLAAAGAALVLLAWADDASATHSAPSHLPVPYAARCTHTLAWPDSNPPGPTDSPLILDFQSDADVLASPYYAGGNGTPEDPALLHVPGCLQVFIRITGTTLDVEVTNTTFWSLHAVPPATAASMGLPGGCSLPAAVFCIHSTDGTVNVRDFFLNHDMPLMNVEDANVRVLQTPTKELPRAGSLGDVESAATVTLEQVFWYGVDATTRLQGGNVDLVLSSIHAAGSWCMLDTASYILPANLPPTGALPLGVVRPHADTRDALTGVLGDTPVPEWVGQEVDRLWAANLEAREEAMDRWTYLPAYEGDAPGMELVLFNLTSDARLRSFGSSIGGAFILVKSVDSRVESIQSDFGCSVWGVISEDSPITSVKTTFHEVAFPYKLDGSDDIMQAFDPLLGAGWLPGSPPAPTIPADAFISICDEWGGTFPVGVFSPTKVSLIGTNFREGVPVWIEDAADQADLHGGMHKLMPMTHDVNVYLGSHDPTGVRECGGPYNLIDAGSGPGPTMAAAPAAPLWRLLDGTCTPIPGPLGLDILGVLNVPLVAPDLTAVHLLMGIPTPDGLSKIGFYNFALNQTGGFGFDTSLVAGEFAYCFEDGSLANVCIGCSANALGLNPSPGGLGTVASFVLSSWSTNALTSCMTLTLLAAGGFEAVAERSATSCGEGGMGTDWSTHTIQDEVVRLDLDFNDRGPRRLITRVAKQPGGADAYHLDFDHSQDVAALGLNFEVLSLVNIDATITGMIAAEHDIDLKGDTATCLAITASAAPYQDGGPGGTAGRPIFARSLTLEITAPAVGARAYMDLRPITGPKGFSICKNPDSVTLVADSMQNAIDHPDLAGMDTKSLDFVLEFSHPAVAGALHIDGKQVHVQSQGQWQVTLEPEPHKATFETTTGYLKDVNVMATVDGAFIHFNTELLSSVDLLLEDGQVTAGLETPDYPEAYADGPVSPRLWVVLDAAGGFAELGPIYDKYRLEGGFNPVEGTGSFSGTASQAEEYHIELGVSTESAFSVEADLQILPAVTADQTQWKVTFDAASQHAALDVTGTAIGTYLVGGVVSPTESFAINGHLLQSVDVGYAQDTPHLTMTTPREQEYYQTFGDASFGFEFAGETPMELQLSQLAGYKRFHVEMADPILQATGESEQDTPYLVYASLTSQSGFQFELLNIKMEPLAGAHAWQLHADRSGPWSFEATTGVVKDWQVRVSGPPSLLGWPLLEAGGNIFQKVSGSLAEDAPYAVTFTAPTDPALYDAPGITLFVNALNLVRVFDMSITDIQGAVDLTASFNLDTKAIHLSGVVDTVGQPEFLARWLPQVNLVTQEFKLLDDNGETRGQFEIVGDLMSNLYLIDAKGGGFRSYDVKIFDGSLLGAEIRGDFASLVEVKKNGKDIRFLAPPHSSSYTPLMATQVFFERNNVLEWQGTNINSFDLQTSVNDFEMTNLNLDEGGSILYDWDLGLFGIDVMGVDKNIRSFTTSSGLECTNVLAYELDVDWDFRTGQVWMWEPDSGHYKFFGEPVGHTTTIPNEERALARGENVASPDQAITNCTV